jgi:hypothetical protein
VTDERRYSREEMNAILTRALEQTAGDHVTHAELLELARELGVPADAIQAATAEVDAQRSDQPILRRWRRKALRGFLIHTVAYLLSTATFALLLATSGETVIPAVAIMLLWGIGLASHGLAAFLPDEHRIIERHWERERKRLAKQKSRRTIEAITAASTDTVSALVHGIKHAVEDHVGTEPRAGFEQKAGDTPRVRVADAPRADERTRDDELNEHDESVAGARRR